MAGSTPTWVTEGGVRIPVDHVSTPRGPGKRTEGVFYNPAMAVNRDVSVLALEALHEPRWRVLDGLAATGIRGLRMARGVPDARVVLNDHDESAVERIRAAARDNDLADRTTVTHRGFEALCHEELFRWVDVDPFGSPAPLVPAATAALERGGILAATATDTAALNGGVYPRPVLRRYGAESMRCPFGHELALRILSASIARAAAARDLAATPILCHATDHYDRVYLRVEPGAQRADDALRQLAWAAYCPACGHRSLQPQPGDACPACNAPATWAGPLWGGPLQDPDLAAACLEAAEDVELARARETRTLLEALGAEATAPPLFYDVHESASRAGVGAPSTADLHGALRERGYVAAPTHVTPLGVKTDAPADVFHGVLQDLAEL